MLQRLLRSIIPTASWSVLTRGQICDFNLGSDKIEKGKTPPLMTPVGTPEFMAPEVAEAISAGNTFVTIAI